jgi:hypothetical protein
MKLPHEHALRDEMGHWVERDSGADYANYVGQHRLFESSIHNGDQVYMGCPACVFAMTE